MRLRLNIFGCIFEILLFFFIVKRLSKPMQIFGQPLRIRRRFSVNSGIKCSWTPGPFKSMHLSLYAQSGEFNPNVFRFTYRYVLPVARYQLFPISVCLNAFYKLSQPISNWIAHPGKGFMVELDLFAEIRGISKRVLTGFIAWMA